MGSGIGRVTGARPPSMTFLKWAAIVLPLLFLVSVDILRHSIFFTQLHTRASFYTVYAVAAIAVFVFAHVMFGFIGRLQRRVLQQNRQLSALNTIAAAAASKPKLQELLDTSLEHILHNLQADAGLVCLVDLEKEEHSAVCYRGLSAELVGRLQRAKLRDDPIASQVVRSGRPVKWERILEDPHVSEAAKREGIRSGISAPLKYEGEVNGILVIATHKKRQFAEADKQFLDGVGGQLGMAIRNAVLYERANLQNRELTALLAVGKTVTSSHDLDELLGSSLDAIVEVTSAEAAEVWLCEGQDELALRCHRGAHEEVFAERVRLRVGEGIPGLVAKTHEPIAAHDLAADPRFVRQQVISAGYRTFYALPLLYRGKLVGVLAVAAISAEALKASWELRLLDGIGEWLALALENTRLYQQVQDVAIVQEREWIAREMHDGMAQLLGYINTQTIALKRLLASQQLEEARAELTKMEEIARDLYADVREQILGLRATVHRHDGLLPALQDYAARFTEMCGIKVELRLSAPGGPLRLAPPAEIQVTRIVQEALTNVRKHSHATAATICFDRSGAETVVTIVDNGHGFDLARLPARGWPRFGLQTMRERAEAVGGTLAIEAESGRGTRVELRIPSI